MFNKTLISALFLSSVLAAQPCGAKGDDNVFGDRTIIGRSLLKNTCRDLGMGVLSNAYSLQCALAEGKTSGEILRMARPVPYLINIDTMLDKTRWAYEDTSFIKVKKKPAPVYLKDWLYSFVIILVFLSGLIFWLRAETFEAIRKY
jgi:hypothetical protein